MIIKITQDIQTKYKSFVAALAKKSPFSVSLDLSISPFVSFSSENLELVQFIVNIFTMSDLSLYLSYESPNACKHVRMHVYYSSLERTILLVSSEMRPSETIEIFGYT